MWVFLPASLWLAAAGAVASGAEPEQSDLDAAQDVLDASEPEATTSASSDDGTAPLFEISWSTLLTASGREPETNLQFDADGWRVENLLRPRRDKLYPSSSVSIYTEITAADWLLFRGLLDTREIRDGGTLEPPLEGLTMGGNPVAQELRSGNVLRELSAVLGHDAVTVEVGRFRADVADGLVYKDFGAGVRVRADLEDLDIAPLQGEVLLTTVGQRVQDFGNNQLLSVQLDWMLSPFEYVGFFVALSEDRNGEVSEVLRSAYAETLIPDQQKLDSLFLQDEGHGSQGYIGAIVQLITAQDAVLRARVALSGGKLAFRVPLEAITREEQLLEGREIEVDVGGYAADLELRFGLSDAVELAGLAFALSGDQPPQRDGDEYRSFIGLAPYWVWSGLFFSGGLAQGLYPNRATAAGVNGRGVLGLGPSLAVEDGPLRGELRAFVLASAADPPPPPLGGETRLYGGEVDLLGEWQPLSWLGFAAELDLFFPGSFFPSRRVAYLALAMVTLSNAD
jgi:hypothetical protein